MAGNDHLHPPGPFADFEFSYTPSSSSVTFPEPPPVPPSADLFSTAETNLFYGFLDSLNWELDDLEPTYAEVPQQKSSRTSAAPYSNPHARTSPGPSTRQSIRDATTTKTKRSSSGSRKMATRNSSSSHHQPPPPPPTKRTDQPQADSARGTKPLLSSPQKRLNHIMSEQKRRNAIRDGYAQLIALLAPAGTPGIRMPTRGRPKGSGGHNKGGSKGKSGVLFRAVEYIKWLEEGCDALRAEVLKVEAI